MTTSKCRRCDVFKTCYNFVHSTEPIIDDAYLSAHLEYKESESSLIQNSHK